MSVIERECQSTSNRSIYNIVKAPVGWSIFTDDVRLGGIYGTKEAALEAATLAASFSIRDGQGIQINVPEHRATTAAAPTKWNDLLK